MLSVALMGVLHTGQNDLGETRETLFGTLYMTTFRKEPIIIPKRVATTIA